MSFYRGRYISKRHRSVTLRSIREPGGTGLVLRENKSKRDSGEGGGEEEEGGVSTQIGTAQSVFFIFIIWSWSGRLCAGVQPTFPLPFLSLSLSSRIFIYIFHFWLLCPIPEARIADSDITATGSQQQLSFFFGGHNVWRVYSLIGRSYYF